MAKLQDIMLRSQAFDNQISAVAACVMRRFTRSLKLAIGATCQGPMHAAVNLLTTLESQFGT